MNKILFAVGCLAMVSVLTSTTLSAQAPCVGNIVLTSTNTSGSAARSYAYTDAAGVILGVTSATSFTNVPEGPYNVYALQYETGSLPATWAVGQNISATTPDACNQIEGPVAVEIGCCGVCTDAMIIVTKVTQPSCPTNTTVTLKIVNGDVILPTGANITFYDGDPTMPGATRLGTYITTGAIAANATENIPNVSIGACNIASSWIYAVLGDNGTAPLPIALTGAIIATGSGVSECIYENNMSGFKLKEPCGKFTSMIKQ